MINSMTTGHVKIKQKQNRRRQFTYLAFAATIAIVGAFQSGTTPSRFGGKSATEPSATSTITAKTSRSFRTKLFDSSSSSSREEEIRQTIQKLKDEGILGKRRKSQSSPEAFDDSNDNAYDDYAEKLKAKLGKRKSQLLGFTSNSDRSRNSTRIADDDDDDGDNSISSVKADEDGLGGRQIGRIGSYQQTFHETTRSPALEETKQQQIKIDPAIFDLTDKLDEELVEPPELSEEELVELVAEKLAEKRAKKDAAIEAASKVRRGKEALEKDANVTNRKLSATKLEEDQKSTQTTTGVGGSWTKTDELPTDEYYQPKSGSWGAFPRPKDVSKAYGGGRRIGAGYSNEDDGTAENTTKNLLKDYRKNVGIEVPTEKAHATEIEEALSIGQRAMQRGVYATAVSALEKVTIWCSTNSKVGSKVYLELAMAYEAVGRTEEACQVYTTLSDCRMEDVKYNAKRLLYGLQAMEMMRSVSSDFSRKKTKNAFIDATGLANIASNFDDVYQTAYVDLDNGYYKKLTESVVRSSREARQILIQASVKGKITRTRIVQALRFLSRQFDDLLRVELTSSIKKEPTAYLNGKPIIKESSSSNDVISLSDFNLLSADEMIENLEGEWRLQLLADKQGDGVSYFNTSAATQIFSTNDMTFSASYPENGLFDFICSGKIDMEDTKRILSKKVIETSNSGVRGFVSLISGKRDSGFSGSVSRQQQIISVDSLLMITRGVPGPSREKSNTEKEYFAVWRRIDT